MNPDPLIYGVSLIDPQRAPDHVRMHRTAADRAERRAARRAAARRSRWSRRRSSLR